jgi:hypothetical protein
MEAYVHGMSTRKVDDLVQALGVGSGISKSEVSRICGELDGDLDAFRNRPLDHVEFPYVFPDATYIKGRVNGRVVSRAVVVATGVTATAVAWDVRWSSNIGPGGEQQQGSMPGGGGASGGGAASRPARVPRRA